MTQQQPSASTAISVVAAPQDKPDRLSWQDVAVGVSEGSWAVLLAAFLLYWAFKRPVAKYLDRHISLLEVMRATLQQNASNIEQLRKTDEVTAEALKKVGDRLIVLEDKAEQTLDAVYTLTDQFEESRPLPRRVRLPRRADEY